MHLSLTPSVGLQLAAGQWYAAGTKSRKQATQYFEVVGYLTHPVMGYVTLVITVIGLLSTGIAQIIACRYTRPPILETLHVCRADTYGMLLPGRATHHM